MWKIRIVKVGRAYEAHGYLDGVCQGSFWWGKSEEKLIRDCAQRYPNVEIMASN